MGKKRFAKDPLLYIHQPTIRTPEAPMQSNYITSRETKEKSGPIQANTPAEPTQKKPLKRNSFHQKLAQTTEQSKPPRKVDTVKWEQKSKVIENDEEKQETMDKDTIKFIDMTVEQKVAYFSEAPSYAPKMRCEIKTEGRSYRGVITEAKDGEVFIRVGKRSTSTKIRLADIIDIRMLGF